MAFISTLDLPLFHSGKVRDTYVLPKTPKPLLVVASDRISTHNVVHNTMVHCKGELLTALTHYWVEQLRVQQIPTHIFASGVRIYELLPDKIREQHPLLHRRAFVIHKLTISRFEFIFRNFLTGSLHKAYKQGLDPYGLNLPRGLREMHHFDEPIFTPTDKSETDVPQNSQEIIERYPREYSCGLNVFRFMTTKLASVGITLIDSKFELSADMLADEFGTMDSSRFLRTSDLKHAEPFWLDKQYFRNIVEARLKQNDGKVVPITFSPAEVAEGLERMHQVFRMITGKPLAHYQEKYLD